MTSSSDFHPEFWKGLLWGLFGSSLAICLIVVLIGFVFLRQHDVYDNDHWKLNIKVPFSTMWMNMGYWTDTNGQRIRDFQQACRTLLYEVLAEAGVLEDEFLVHKLAILDLGIGCGDQSLELAQLIHQGSWDEYRYVGLTLNPSQFHLASKQPFQQFQIPRSHSRTIQVFRADAARPGMWDEDVKSAITSLANEYPEDQARWVLALDCMYHFSPDRKLMFNFAAQELDASFMAFDLLLGDTTSFQQKLLVKIIGLAMGCPVGAFMTETKYKKQLSEAGYHEKHISFRDITDHVFSGLVDHIKRQEEALRPFGISVGKFKVAGKVFSWFARSKALRATIVVARNKPKRL
ncbi:hypothetical protein CSPAE12_02893 [Colletotrichum incanum]|nr:hypothetical protein CSPAE12_02893 [Colletotrichum incanum]